MHDVSDDDENSEGVPVNLGQRNYHVFDTIAIYDIEYNSYNYVEKGIKMCGCQNITTSKGLIIALGGSSNYNLGP